MSDLRGELGWLLRHPIDAIRWWFYRLVIARLNGDRAAAKRYEEDMRMTPERIERARRILREKDFPRQVIKLYRRPDSLNDLYEAAEFACPYDQMPLVAPWQKCPKCGRND